MNDQAVDSTLSNRPLLQYNISPREGGVPLSSLGNLKQCRNIASELWSLLDDIDTASDMFKPSDERSHRAFYRYVMKRVSTRHDHLISDGYDLFLSSPEENPDE